MANEAKVKIKGKLGLGDEQVDMNLTISGDKDILKEMAKGGEFPINTTRNVRVA